MSRLPLQGGVGVSRAFLGRWSVQECVPALEKREVFVSSTQVFLIECLCSESASCIDNVNENVQTNGRNFPQ